MAIWKTLGQAAVAGTLMLGMAASHAAPVKYFGEDLGGGEGVRLASHPNSDAARAAFLAALINPGVETFESFSDGTGAPLTVNFGTAGSATLLGEGSVNSVPTGTNGVGRYPISGTNYWETGSAPSIVFSAPVAAFGFYGVDIGDFGGQITVTLAGISGTTTLTIDNTVNGPGGSVLYFGIIDTANPFTSVTFGNTAPGDDFFGFDDFTIGSVEQVREDPNGNVPVPATLALLGIGGVGLAFLRRRKR